MCLMCTTAEGTNARRLGLLQRHHSTRAWYQTFWVVTDLQRVHQRREINELLHERAGPRWQPTKRRSEHLARGESHPTYYAIPRHPMDALSKLHERQQFDNRLLPPTKSKHTHACAAATSTHGRHRW
jgi:hypothetical protein